MRKSYYFNLSVLIFLVCALFPGTCQIFKYTHVKALTPCAYWHIYQARIPHKPTRDMQKPFILQAVGLFGFLVFQLVISKPEPIPFALKIPEFAFSARGSCLCQRVQTSKEGQTWEGGEEGKKIKGSTLHWINTFISRGEGLLFKDQKEYITKKFILRIKSCPVDQAFHNEWITSSLKPTTETGNWNKKSRWGRKTESFLTSKIAYPEVSVSHSL